MRSFTLRARWFAACAVAATSGIVACGSAPDVRPMLSDGKEVIYASLSQGDRHAADEALDDVWDVDSHSLPVRISPITWNENPSDARWRSAFYALRPLSNLLNAFYTTGNVAYRDKLLEVVRSYDAFEAQRGDAAHPYLDEPATASLRAMMLVNVYGKLTRTHDLPDDVAAGMRASIAKVSAFLAASEHFEDGRDQAFDEAAALLVAAVNFPDMPKSADWLRLASARLAWLSLDGIDQDGVAIENSPSRQLRVLSSLREDARWMTTYGVPKPAGLDATIARMFDYATYATQPDGYVPLLGASEAMSLRALPAAIYAGSSIGGPPGADDVPSSFTFVRELGESGTAPKGRNVRFSASGQSFLRSGFGGKNDFIDQTWASFNVGNYRSRLNHYDALGITYFASGKVLLPDAGLYAYDSVSTSDPYAAYFKSTRAHNAVVVDGKDQAPTSGPGVTAGALIEAAWLYQSGRHVLYEGVIHRRSVVVLQRDLSLVVDALESSDVHEYLQTWHFEPKATLTTNGIDIVAADENGKPELGMHQAIVGGVTLSLVKGQETPIVQGFHSDEASIKVANYAAEYRRYATDAGFATLLASGPYATRAPAFHATFDRAADTTTVTVCIDDVRIRVSIVHQAGDGERIVVEPAPSCF